MLIRTALTPGAIVPTYHGGLADLYNKDPILLDTGTSTKIDTGVQIEIPEGYIGIVVPRSSTLFKYGLHVTTGIIDPGYCGPGDTIKIVATADRYTRIATGTRLAQLGVFRADALEFMLVNYPISSKARGGFGSTGR